MVSFLLTLLCWLMVGLGLFMVAGTLLSFSHHPHWFIRGWEFPRGLIAALALLSGGIYFFFCYEGGWSEWFLFRGPWQESLFLWALLLCVLWQSYKIFPYTPLAPKHVKRASRASESPSIRLVASNVEMENEQFDRWLRVVRQADPDVILVVEVNDAWLDHIEALEETHPYVVRQPQENYYGMMLFSRLKLVDPEVRFIVQDDIPSIHTGVELEGGQQIYLHGVHPRPPEPIRDQGSTPRDAEVVILGREIDDKENHQPTIIAGDFNDVAWSHTSRLFRDLSGLLDPRKGRGLYNSFNAKNPLFRFPLDHVFHSNEFKLVNLELLDYVGSDHFPVLLELSYEPEAQLEQPDPEPDPEDEEEAEEKIEQAEEEESDVDREPLGE